MNKIRMRNKALLGEVERKGCEADRTDLNRFGAEETKTFTWNGNSYHDFHTQTVTWNGNSYRDFHTYVWVSFIPMHTT